MSYNPNDKAKVKDVISLAQYSAEKIKNEINNLELPTASTTTKGLVKVGNGLSIDNTGTLNAISDTILNTIPSSINGGLWYEIEDGTPVIKIKYNDETHFSTLTPLDPQLTFSGNKQPYSSTYSGHYYEHIYIQPVTVSYLGTGTITVTADYIYQWSPRYDSTNNQIVIDQIQPDPYNDSQYQEVEVIVSLSASPGYKAVTKTILISYNTGPADLIKG